jgi:hypothetical protein
VVKDGNSKDKVWIQMNQLDIVVIKKATKEFTGWETKPALKEGGEHHDFVGVGSRNVFIFCWSSLEDGTGGEKVILNDFEELALVDVEGWNISEWEAAMATRRGFGLRANHKSRGRREVEESGGS